jgi:apolipoprotein N-acyltransferase
VTSVLATVLAAALYAAAFPPFGAAWLGWVALVPLYLALRAASAAAAAGRGALFGGLATLAVLAWLLPTLTGHYERSIFFAAALWLGIGVAAAAPFLAVACAGYARARSSVPAALRPALFAVAWVAAELARTHLGLRSPWALLGDLLAGAERLRQLADLGGVYALSGLVALGNATLAELVALRAHRPREPRAVRAALAASGIFVAVAAATLGYGELRMRRLARPAGGLRVAVVQANEAPALRWRQAAALRVLADHARLTEAELAREPLPDLVVWPESALQIGPRDPRYALSIDALSRRVPLLLGAPRIEDRAGSRLTFNSAWLLGAGGTALTYDKRRLLAFAETRPLGLALGSETRRDLDPGEFAAGGAPGLFPLAREVLGTMICLEALYPADARELAQRGATVLVNLSNDGWYRGRGGAEQHFAGVVLRAVETRLPFVRSTSTGVSAIVDARGEVVAALPAGRAGVLAGSVPPGASGPSLYVRIGDVFALACAALWAAALLFAVASGHRASRSG